MTLAIVVSQEHSLQQTNLSHNRTCNAVTHFHDVLLILNVIGIQGTLKASLLLDDEVTTLGLQVFC